jgi:NAD(P)-dependent dehydrogenase (short-subunit alcohol dehydrogenase family)
MDIKDKTILVIGGWGLVGSAVCRRLIEEKPKRIIVTSLNEMEAKEAVETLHKEFPKVGRNFFVPWWGNILIRHTLKDKTREELLRNEETRNLLIDDLLDELTSDVIERTAIFQLLKQYKPKIVIDCINTATGIAYQDLFYISRETRKAIRQTKEGKEANLTEAVERLLATQYVPQLIRHVQIMYRAMREVGTKIYLKIGTSGTGGMGLNIPYTHSEEKPSSVLLSKSSVAGAHTLLLFLMGRTPDSPITKEIKPAAAIAWKKIGYGEIKKHGKTIELIDCPPEKGLKLKNILQLQPSEPMWYPLNQTLRSAFIDTGENGTFSRAEFEAITTTGQMEYVTPEEIAEAVIFEIKGGNTGHDIINALDNATMAPTYRAGFMFESAIKKLKQLEGKHNCKAVAFEILGPPRLSKIIYEAHLLQKEFGSMHAVMHTSAKELSRRIEEIIKNNAELRSYIISIGIPILLSDGKTLLRGKEIKIPPYRGENELQLTPKLLNAWAHDGWVDLRVRNFEIWKSRFEKIISEVGEISPSDSSSRHFQTKSYWCGFNEIDPGKIAAWIFTGEEKGIRMKA